MRSSRTLAVTIAVIAAAACSADGGSSELQGDEPSGGSGAGLGTGPGSGGQSSGPSGGQGATDDDCAEASSEAAAVLSPADIIIAVDTSGSMDAEADWTQNALPDFVATLAASGIDANVVLIADDSMCVPAPLGSGACSCNDEALPAYRHVCVHVDSNDPLEKILETYPAWQGSLRAGASKTIAVVSDDDSDLGASSFTSQLVALDATLAGFKFDAIVASAPPYTPGNCFLLSAAQGSVYEELVQDTGGMLADLCDQSFDPVFQDMATAVIAGSQIACEYAIPDPGGGETIDFEQVNVEYTPSPGDPPETIYNVPGGAGDCGPQGGWYYDDPQSPTKILLCPESCDAVQQSSDGRVDVIFGCETEIGPPA